MIESLWSLHLQMYISNLGENALVANIIEYNKKMQLTLVCGDLNPSSFVVIFRLGYVIYLPNKTTRNKVATHFLLLLYPE